ncbi:MAG TPA: hypothetical protein VFB58_13560 [Chloroflexota bacterium]|nr:hypothetical protein [Chloroflexota bacterium]
MDDGAVAVGGRLYEEDGEIEVAGGERGAVGVAAEEVVAANAAGESLFAGGDEGSEGGMGGKTRRGHGSTEKDTA